MEFMAFHRNIVAAASLCALISSACGEPLEPVDGDFDDSASFSDGGIADVGPGELDRGECIADAKPTGGVYGYRHQCGGMFVAHLGLSHANESYEIYIPAPARIPFGDEPYESPKVMACCGAMDRQLPLADQPSTYVENCLLDFRQQACLSLATGLATLVDDGSIPTAYRSRALQIQHYLAQHTDACLTALMADGSALPNFLLGARWDLPADGPWSPGIDDVHFEIDIAMISSIDLPPQPLVCSDLDDNNDNVFTSP